MQELELLIISTFISGIVLIVGFILGERTAKGVIRNVGDDISERILQVLQLNSQGNLTNYKFNRYTRNYEPENPDSTTTKL